MLNYLLSRLDGNRFAAVFIAALCASPVARAESILPAATGTIWKYRMTQEFGSGIRPSAGQNAKIDADGKVRLPTTMKVTGTEEIDGVEVHKFEMERAGVVLTVQFLQFNDQGMFELARGNGQGGRVKYDRPQKLLSFPLKVGDKWEDHIQADGQKIDETYEVVAQESVEVPAGKFEAYHVHVVGTKPFRSVVDRWYAPNMGEVKDVTEVQSAAGSMQTRISLELMEPPAGTERPEISAAKPAETAAPKAAGFGPGPGKVKAEEAKEFADELAAGDEEEAKPVDQASITRPDGTITISLRTAEGKQTSEIQAGAKKFILHGEMKGNKPTSVRVILNQAGPNGENRKWGEARIYLSKNQPTEDTTIIVNSGSLKPGNYRADLLIKDEQVATLPFKVVPAVEKK